MHTIAKAAVRSISLKCPECGKGHIFTSYIKLKPSEKCESCGLDLKSFDVGDAPAYFSIFTMGILIPVLAVGVDSYFTVPLWMHALIWVPATLIFCYLTLIYIRSIFIHIEYEVNKEKK